MEILLFSFTQKQCLGKDNKNYILSILHLNSRYTVKYNHDTFAMKIIIKHFIDNLISKGFLKNLKIKKKVFLNHQKKIKKYVYCY